MAYSGIPVFPGTVSTQSPLTQTIWGTPSGILDASLREERATLVKGEWVFLPKVERVAGPLFFCDLARNVLISEMSAVKLFQSQAVWKPMLDQSQLTFDGDIVGYIAIGDLKAHAFLWRPITELASSTRQD